MRYVVGYTANARGHDAVHLAVALARNHDVSLDLVLVIPEDSPFNAVYPPETGYNDILNEQAQRWLDEGLALVPADVTARAHIRRGDSEAQTLIDAAVEMNAAVLVIGATNGGLLKRFTIGSVASSLLHSSPVPVALAPHGYQRTEPLTRLSCGFGTRPGADELLDVAVESARDRGLPLRLVSLLALDGGDSPQLLDAAWMHAADRIAAVDGSPAGSQLPEPEIVVAQGRTVEEAVDRLDWEDGEILLIGSSRLAQHRATFLGSTANRILRALPVPMIVVPRDYTRQSS
ncbi:universal stress protein [Paenarthrobacter aurescens]|uniref:Universal stress protein UspA n=1 Tax=Paenarthrobacter aurescens TaxID=43663 RepID=A0A4Y3NHN5_PAEAU|nr:universal stress protein [Paenarthrobacter aurescens]MDO6141733.1 universal stress protein [Paenarthrobacter aurescens]MDO6149496.1 universal stress protein [Paenarthrobacter aurescens]MDO6156782.1 universal stress protein [Paenarthrobacter aurescens]MDO6160768.1 universal stress protein [Paenarthrobacter aurescens]GEB18616.1 universal stress protein UspA [Paenarthrobacter aurescens]